MYHCNACSYCRCFTSVCLSVNFSHFHLLQNHWANFNKTWHKEGFKFHQMKGPALEK